MGSESGSWAADVFIAGNSTFFERLGIWYVCEFLANGPRLLSLHVSDPETGFESSIFASRSDLARDLRFVLYFRHTIKAVMPDYVSPGVCDEECGQPHSIQGLPSSTAGFVGSTHNGPLVLPSAPLTGVAEFEQTYGGPQPLQFEDASPTPNFMWHAARALFKNGGTRLYVSRVFCPGARSDSDGRRPPRPTTRVPSIRPPTAKLR
jgi:hypothetical protein